MEWHPSASWLYLAWSTLVLISGLIIKAVAKKIRSGGIKTVIKSVKADYPDEVVTTIKWIEKRPRKLVMVTFRSGKTQAYQIAADAEVAFKWNS